MISDAKTQNVIVVVTLLVALVSGGALYNTTAYYGGSYIIVTYLDVNLTNVVVTNLDPTNMTVNPAVSLVFNFKAPEALSGHATLTSLTAKVWLNNDSLSYANFRYTIPADSRTVASGYDRNFTVRGTITELADKYVLYNASASSQWVFSIRLTLFYHVFESSAESVRVLMFAHEGVELVP
ncbi:MAG: hypothetical protein ACTSPE_05000 [Candidatus Thorarchaeota archaeon]